MDANDTAKKKMLKRPQTKNKKSGARSFRRRRVTKVKWDFSRWIFVKVRIVKINWVFIVFLRMSENDVFGKSERRFVVDEVFPRTRIIYYKYSKTEKAFRVISPREQRNGWHSSICSRNVNIVASLDVYHGDLDVDARGKPSTWFSRGWLVKTEQTCGSQ